MEGCFVLLSFGTNSSTAIFRSGCNETSQFLLLLSTFALSHYPLHPVFLPFPPLFLLPTLFACWWCSLPYEHVEMFLPAVQPALRAAPCLCHQLRHGLCGDGDCLPNPNSGHAALFVPYSGNKPNRRTTTDVRQGDASCCSDLLHFLAAQRIGCAGEHAQVRVFRIS